MDSSSLSVGIFVIFLYDRYPNTPIAQYPGHNLWSRRVYLPTGEDENIMMRRRRTSATLLSLSALVTVSSFSSSSSSCHRGRTRLHVVRRPIRPASRAEALYQRKAFIVSRQNDALQDPTLCDVWWSDDST